MGDGLGSPAEPLMWGGASPDSMTGSAVFQNASVDSRATFKPSHPLVAAGLWDFSANVSMVRNAGLVTGGRCGVSISETGGSSSSSEVAWVLRTWWGGWGWGCWATTPGSWHLTGLSGQWPQQRLFSHQARTTAHILSFTSGCLASHLFHLFVS